jgi:flagellar basal body-associated protein FliL
MSDPTKKSSKRPLWYMLTYIVVAIIVAAGLVFYTIPQHGRESSPAERTAAATKK